MHKYYNNYAIDYKSNKFESQKEQMVWNMYILLVKF